MDLARRGGRTLQRSPLLYGGRLRHLRRRVRSLELHIRRSGQPLRLAHGRPDGAGVGARRVHAGAAHHGHRVRRVYRGVQRPRSIRPPAIRDAGGFDHYLRDVPALLPVHLPARPLHRASGQRQEAQGRPHRGHRCRGRRDRQPRGVLRHAGPVPRWRLFSGARHLRPDRGRRIVRCAAKVQGSDLPHGPCRRPLGDGMDATVEDEHKIRWLILIYHLPREPSRHRVAVWRKLKALGALYLQDGAAALPDDAVTREQLEWLQLRVREVGGEATLWEALPNTVAENRALVEAFRSSREEAYRAIIADAERLRRKAQMGGKGLSEQLGKVEREFRAERRRDYFRSPLRGEAAAALKAAREAVRDREGTAGTARTEGEG